MGIMYCEREGSAWCVVALGFEVVELKERVERSGEGLCLFRSRP